MLSGNKKLAIPDVIRNEKAETATDSVPIARRLNPFEEERAEQDAAEYAARNLVRTPERHDGEFWRRLAVAEQLGVRLDEVPELPAGPAARWDFRVDRLDPYRPDSRRRIPSQGEVNRIMRPPRFSMMSTYALKPPKAMKFYDERVHGW
jgi:hypothetical protein